MKTASSPRSRLAAVAVAAVLAVFGLQATAAPASALATVTLTVNITGTGTGSIGVDTSPCVAFPCITAEPYGAGVTISTAPAAGSVFKGWTGACAGQGTTCVLSMTADQTTSARFDLPAAATPAPATAKPTATLESSPAGGSPTSAVQGTTAGPTSSNEPPAAPSPPSATASADPGAPAPGNSGDPPWLPIVAAVVLAMVAVSVAAFQFGARRNRA